MHDSSVLLFCRWVRNKPTHKMTERNSSALYTADRTELLELVALTLPIQLLVLSDMPFDSDISLIVEMLPQQRLVIFVNTETSPC